MNTSQTKPSPLVLNANEEQFVKTSLYPMRMSLLWAFFILGWGTLMALCSINGFFPNGHAGNAWEWSLIGMGGVAAFASLLGSVFVKPLALRLATFSRAKNVQQER